MTWTDRTVISGSTGIVYVQAMADAGAADSSDELGFVTGYSFSQEPEVTEKGPYINSAQIKKTLASYSASGSISVDIADDADVVRNLFFTAITNKTRVKITLIIGLTATGEKHVFSEAIVGVEGEVDPAEGGTYTFSFDADSYVHTAATTPA